MQHKEVIIGCEGSDIKYPEVNVVYLDLFSQEIQLEQGVGPAEFDPSGKNDVVSMSLKQAIKIARQILAFAEEQQA